MPDDMLDQPVSRKINLAAIDTGVDHLIQEAVNQHSDEGLVSIAREIRSTVQIRGLMLAKLLFEWRGHTRFFGVSEDNWEDHVYSTTGLSLQTIRKYTDVWTLFAGNMVPEELKEDLAAKPMQGLMLLPAAAREEQLSSEDWQEIANAPDAQAIRDVVRRARGAATSSETTIRIVLQRDGTLVAWQNGVSCPIGYISNTIEQPFGRSAIERILRATGIMQE